MIVVTAPTGLIGHQVLNNLLESDEPIRVIARDPSRLPAHTRERVEVVQGSHGDLDVVTRAFAGAESVFWLVPPDPHAESVEAAYVDFSWPACEAFKRQGVKRVVGVSALGRGTPWAAHAGLVTASLAMDDLIASTGVSYRALTNPSFMDNLLRQVESIKNQGMFSLPISGDLEQPSCATRDIAAAGARLLLTRARPSRPGCCSAECPRPWPRATSTCGSPTTTGLTPPSCAPPSPPPPPASASGARKCSSLPSWLEHHHDGAGMHAQWVRNGSSATGTSRSDLDQAHGPGRDRLGVVKLPFIRHASGQR